ncbi:MAG: Co2+/Mg2+ efflux protein ApaG [Thiothrix sp.]|nr:Co2+/Mg2+ efflux protein ApaG [Thiothrix sp.]HPE61467.1 Co2+/Mg2+ efflux protein ApaG [Thiolinea sp.]
MSEHEAWVYDIRVSVESRYLEQESDPDIDRYVFAYTVTIVNQGNIAARLLSRHWLITDSNGNTQEVRGEGVVGEQPYLEPGEGFRYSSGAVLETPIGAMQGSYTLRADDGVQFDAPIPVFSLSDPRKLH